ncbi:hypothetical protein JR316_0008627 [Psilocybe cubensis]|uniref:Reverse transcriptase RNase H-like domain-containing protein n=2 Tax=Psilocybe cubensis TaxID=181762 RepID=A0A8H7XY91_PSICU|nr:hypothetical protein JR316_0008627 [Psilocybe cubensis]KAH9478174.1 hypothetical protein JR316_0008627 [Psilocybe cubensis]
MESAHGYHAESDSHSALNTIKAMIRISERTPRYYRTDTQAFLQKYWRSPSLNTFNALLPVVAYTDASDWGIGFYLSSFKQSLAYSWIPGKAGIPIGPTGQVITSWAELIAVEMAIHTLIMLDAIDTLYPTVILSDNDGVVKALSSGYWTPNYGLDGIVKRIISTCYTHRIILDIRWIPSKANLADGASKGRFSSPQLREMEAIWENLYDPELTRLLMIPPHLRSLTEPIGF